jgi:hypothetical protein
VVSIGNKKGDGHSSEAGLVFGLGVEADSAESGSVGCQDSNSVRAMPLCRMMERRVPMASSG